MLLTFLRKQANLRRRSIVLTLSPQLVFVARGQSIGNIKDKQSLEKTVIIQGKARIHKTTDELLKKWSALVYRYFLANSMQSRYLQGTLVRKFYLRRFLDAKTIFTKTSLIMTLLITLSNVLLHICFLVTLNHVICK